MTHAVHGPLVQRLGVWVPSGARLSGARADAAIEVDQVEHERRLAHGLGAVTDLALLETFMSLPHELPVPMGRLDASQVDRLARAPRGCCTVESSGSGDELVRLLQRPCSVQLVVVRGRGRAPLEVAARFTSAAPVVLQIPPGVEVESSTLWEAQLIGVGVWQDEGESQRELLPPERPPAGVFKAARWRFEEMAYRGWLTGPRPARPGRRSAAGPAAADSSALGRIR